MFRFPRDDGTGKNLCAVLNNSKIMVVFKCAGCGLVRPAENAPGADLAGAFAALAAADLRGGAALVGAGLPLTGPEWRCSVCLGHLPRGVWTYEQNLVTPRPLPPQPQPQPQLPPSTQGPGELEEIYTASPFNFVRPVRNAPEDVPTLLRKYGVEDGPALVRAMGAELAATLAAVGYAPDQYALFLHRYMKASDRFSRGDAIHTVIYELLVDGNLEFCYPITLKALFEDFLPTDCKQLFYTALKNRRYNDNRSKLYAALYHVPPGQQLTKWGFRQLSRGSLTPWANLTNTMAAAPIRKRLEAYLCLPAPTLTFLGRMEADGYFNPWDMQMRLSPASIRSVLDPPSVAPLVQALRVYQAATRPVPQAIGHYIPALPSLPLSVHLARATASLIAGRPAAAGAAEAVAEAVAEDPDLSRLSLSKRKRGF